MKEQIENVQKRAKEEIVNASTLEKLDEVRVKYLGKKGELTLVLRGMGGLTKEERPVIGSLVNKVRDELENLISAVGIIGTVSIEDEDILDNTLKLLSDYSDSIMRK